MPNVYKSTLAGFNRNEVFSFATLIAVYDSTTIDDYEKNYFTENREFFLCSLTLDGCGIIHTKDKDFEVKKDQIFFGKHRDIYKFSANTEWHFNSFWFHISGYELPVNNIFDYDFTNCQHDKTKEIINLLNSNDVLDIFKANSQFTLMLISFLKHISENSVLNMPSYKPIENAITYINLNITEKFNIAELAQKFGYCDRHFRTLFLKFSGLNPKDYILKKKIEYSSSLLLTSAFSINNIAEMLNFSTTGLFINTFKKFYNCTPLEYRKRSPSQSIESFIENYKNKL